MSKQSVPHAMTALPDLSPGRAQPYPAGVSSDGLNSLTDIAEEISQHLAHKIEEKHHAQRKSALDKTGHTIPAQAIVEFFQRTHETTAQAKLQAFVDSLLANYGLPRQAAAHIFQDPTQQYLALQYALHQGLRDGAPAEVLDDLRDTLADFEAEQGTELYAAFNSMEAASEYGASAREVQRFQRAYRDTVLDVRSLPDAFRRALTQFQGQDLARGIALLIRALGHDIAATRPSTEPTRLHALLRDLYQMETAATVLENCRQLAGTLPIPEAQHHDLIHQVASISGETWIPASRFESLCQKFELHETATRIRMLAGARNILRDLPMSIFPSPEVRQSVLAAAQEALDAAAAKEDAGT